MQASSIDQVIDFLEAIVLEAIENNSPIGYFPALYLEVTKSVRTAIHNKEFENNERMEHLDVIFANRYLAAYTEYKNGQVPTLSWEVAFAQTEKFWPIVLQHLLLGMNAHISLDLGIAAARISPGNEIDSLENDFNKINTILASLVGNVESTLSRIWPKLKFLLKLTGKVDDFFINFSMELARNEAWHFAKQLAPLTLEQQTPVIAQKDIKVSKGSDIVIHPGVLITGLLRIIRLGERGSVASKIEKFIIPKN